MPIFDLTRHQFDAGQNSCYCITGSSFSLTRFSLYTYTAAAVAVTIDNPEQKRHAPPMSKRLNQMIGWSRMKPREERIAKLNARGGGKSQPKIGGNQRVMVNAAFVKPGKLSAHAAYLQREGAGIGQEEGDRAETFSDKNREADLEPKKGEPRFFKLIISPEAGEEIKDMKAYTQDVMAKVAKESGYDLNWTGVVHNNTDNPHAHVIVRGLDHKNNEVTFDREFIKSGMRDIAQDRATKELGPRTKKQIQEQLNKETTQDRLTSIDRRLGHREEENKIKPERNIERERLKHLEGLGLAKRKGKTYEMQPEWQKTLKDYSHTQDIKKTLARTGFTPEQLSKLRIAQQGADGSGPNVKNGLVVATGIADQHKLSSYAIVKSQGGKLHYIEGKGVDRLRENQRCNLENGALKIARQTQQTRSTHQKPRQNTREGIER